MNDEQRLRYSRHILLSEFAEQGQEILLESRVAIIGVGGLGSSAAMYLAAAGVGEIVLVDDDHVELGNLQRQVIHSTPTIGKPKVESAKQLLQQLNPEVRYYTRYERLDETALAALANEVDVVLDCTDNFPSRFAINRACIASRTPLVSASAIRLDAQIAVFTHNTGCYRCLYEDETATADTCSERGVLGPLLGVMGSMQAMEAIKVLTHTGKSLEGRLLLFDARYAEWRQMKFTKDPLCPVCNT